MELFMFNYYPLHGGVEKMRFETIKERTSAICGKLHPNSGETDKEKKAREKKEMFNRPGEKVYVLVVNDYWRSKVPIISDFQIVYVFDKFYQIIEVLKKIHQHSDYIYSLYECVSYEEAYKKALLLQVDNPDRYAPVSKSTMRAEYQAPTGPTVELTSVPTGPTPGHTGAPGSIGTVEWEGYQSPPYPTGQSGHVGSTGTKHKGWPRKFMDFIARLFKNLLY